MALSSKLAQVRHACPPGGRQSNVWQHLALQRRFLMLLQDDLHIVDSVNISSPDPQDLLHLIREKLWGESVLIVDV